MKNIREFARVIRSKNSSPFKLTLDIIFKEQSVFEEVKRRPVYIVAEEAGLGLPRRRQRASVADLTGANTAQPDLPDELPPGVTWQ